MEKSALILTGGEGSRLRPITDNTPAALLKICNRPLIDYTLDTLRKQGYETISVAADRRADLVAEHLADCPDTDLIFSPLPCGSCLPVARAAKDCESFLTVIFGNILFDSDLSAAEKFHAATGADVTIVTRIVDSPSDHALATADENNRITALIPDPARENCCSDLALTGIFIIDKAVAEDAENYNHLLTDFLPKIAERGKVMNFTANGKFLSVTTPDDLFSASEAISATLDPAKRIAPSAQISGGVKLSSDTVIGENATICRGAELNGAIISDGAYIGERVKVNGFIGKGAKLLSGAVVESGAIVGDNSIIGEQAVVCSGVKIRSGARLEAYSTAKSDTGGAALPMKITDDGICGETGSVITPQLAAIAGSAAAALGGKIGVAFRDGNRDGNAAESLALALCTGISSAGAEAWFFGAASEPALCYCTEKSGLSGCCYIDSGVTTKIRLFSGDGLPLSRREEKLVEQGLKGSYRTAAFNRFGKIRNVSAMTEMYGNSLENAAPKKLSATRAVLNTSGKTVSETCEKILGRINCKDGSPVVFHIGSDGRGVSAYTEETGYVFEEKLIMICCKNLFEQGRDAAVPHNFPKAVEKLAETHGRTVHRYSLCPSDSSDFYARKLAAEMSFASDGAMLMFTVLSVLERRGISLAEAVAELPESAVCTRFVPIGKHPLKLMKSVTADKKISGDGITISDEKGQVYIRPVKTEKGILMQAESFSMEAASELCDFYQDLVSREDKL
ncbi:MAG: NTP transferase domain-containing protein [Oscillospiraceae bacterium]|nr:NTP transferase domain-containing protein [Oscillospiraceae bacterium]